MRMKIAVGAVGYELEAKEYLILDMNLECTLLPLLCCVYECGRVRKKEERRT